MNTRSGVPSAVTVVGRTRRAAARVAVSFLAALVVASPAGAQAPATSGSPAAGPTKPPVGVVLPYPDGCPAYGLSERRCAYIVDWARQEAGYDPSADVRYELLGDPACADGTVVCQVNRTTAFIVRVRVTAPDGRWSDQSVFCGVGGQYSLLCTGDPAIDLRLPIPSGYEDTPCSGEAGDDTAANVCASPVPSADPEARAQAVPLRGGSLVIPIEHAGPYEVVLGEAELPNGILSDATASLADPAPMDLVVSEDGMRLEITSLDGGPPFVSAYEHGWHPGVEHVEARLVFAVESFEPGAVFEVTDVLVR